VQFNWLDYVLIGTVATVAAVQFLRSTRDFSRVMYETILVLAAVITASLLYRPLRQATHFSAPLLYGGIGTLLAALGMLLAALLSARAGFSLGVFGYLFGLALALTFAYTVGHLALRTANMAISPHNARFALAVRRSLTARDLLYLKTLIEILAFLRFARWKGV
jgi:hypothetical protein